MVENKDILNQILATLTEQDKFQEVVRIELECTRKEFQEVKKEQAKMYELLLTARERVSEPLDNIEALSKRVWSLEKDLSHMQRKTGMK
ncbi:hypothetical protein CFK37_04410 [Virgibacillus phasianinus]|uniref:Uncharacterized protein n=1 Tax=Virgibacillus phasianinus TaxID=2017483 RepID=A0A220U037_9BACI|nr:hypothetical protein [Virgibacillus phasianinus]ASK61468.1 hypothetical protein CFK37_04410 [Virgibacillus phasianinus]